MHNEALEEVNLKPKPRALRMLRSRAARTRRRLQKSISETRLVNEYNKLRRLRKKK
jgi:hypothetical protein